MDNVMDAKRLESRQKKKLAGVVMVDACLAVLVVAGLVTFFISITQRLQWEEESKYAAEQLVFMADAVKGLVRGEGKRIIDNTAGLERAPGTTPGTGLVLDFDTEPAHRDMLLKYMPAGMSLDSMPRYNIWGAKYQLLLVRKPYFATIDGAEIPKPELDTLTAILYTDNGRPYSPRNTNLFLRKKNPRAALIAGSMAGATHVGEGTTLRGVGWSYDVPGIKTGHIGAIVNYDEDAGGGPFLYRVDVGDPTLNTMYTNLNMDRNHINQVRSIHLANNVSLATWEQDCKNNTLTHQDGRQETNYDNEGRLFYVSTEEGNLEQNSLAICRRGRSGERSLAFIGDTHVEDQIKYITMASDGDQLPKPLCSPNGGITGNVSEGNLVPRIFVMPQVVNNGPDSRVIHAINAYAVDINDNQWQVVLNVLTSENGIRKWTYITDPPDWGGVTATERNQITGGDARDYLKVVAIAVCSGKSEAF